MKTLLSTLLLLCATGLLSFNSVDDDSKLSPAEREIIKTELPSYPLTTCLVSKRALDSGDGPFDLVVNGHLFRVCCPGCEDAAKAKAEELRAAIERAVISAQRAHWPFKKCPVSGESYEKTGSQPVEFVHGTRYIKLCCKSCVSAFEYGPEVFMKEIDAAYIAEQLKAYPLKTCPISEKPLGEKPVDILYGTTLVRLCCKGCQESFDEDPKASLKKVQRAWAKAHREKAAAKSAERSTPEKD
jgi:hypothetical protein